MSNRRDIKEKREQTSDRNHVRNMTRQITHHPQHNPSITSYATHYHNYTFTNPLPLLAPRNEENIVTISDSLNN